MKHVFSFTGISKVTLEHHKGSDKSHHVDTRFILDVSGNLDKSRYINDDGLPTQDGVQPLTIAFVHGIAGNIHYAHQAGIWDSAKHLRYVIDELTRAFATVANVEKGVFEDGQKQG